MVIRVVMELTWQDREFDYLLWVSFHSILNICTEPKIPLNIICGIESHHCFQYRAMQISAW